MPTGFFNQPHPFELSLSRRLKRAFLVGLFIALFLGIFQPFGLSNLNGIWPLAIGYGLVTFLAMALIDVVLIARKIDAERWDLGKELLASAINILLIGAMNAVYSAFMGIAAFSWMNVVNFTIYTFLIGIFPVSAIVLINFQRKKAHNIQTSGEINAELIGKEGRTSDQDAKTSIILQGENKDERSEFPADALCYLKAADNYVEVHHRKNAQPDRLLMRGALRSFEEQLADRPQFMRCHKSFIVNLDLVLRVSGNAQGLKLHLDDDGEVPVSRSLNAEVQQRLSVRPGTISRSPRELPVRPKA